ncbi:ribose-phosphate diphosphokinase [Colletotrichum paranaense]|uniref:Ribose-phosphate diphosphokinase n=5 Tax=Colletotrichum acutatum species complex TaxID=2707335 RepID=A0A9Q8W8G7_9PEZI|nr:ribose-phosphate diphosphokinase [Colletotrichum lupini]XP_060317458.1 ribose-phosphate diphosphokinase [Colletotrichum costaricense]XP_060341391.1 ribose-phosphate diphosphokinase [Colletotrichum paranaense]XP_060386980.1 ribose-phosphate diphosphokinase [Colletotrichum tamarilloi]KAK1481306.1 ribose-phosphate diphosphokinase [Colletotrichum cuscutae]KAK1508522.1 ribose-phosphate diphosphokinase [Colletotrichum tamarilloi]KAK1519129.1 ribose-phosphate diphosphokinase [Colletotrichum paran
MVRNIIVLGGNSHPELLNSVCNNLGLNPCERILSKFSVGESRCEIKDSVRGKDVFIVQTASGNVNDNFMDLCIMISACKTGSAKRVTAVMPLFPYSRQPDVPYKKAGAPLSKPAAGTSKNYTFESVPATPGPGIARSMGLPNGIDGIASKLAKSKLNEERSNGMNGVDHSKTNGNGRSHHDSVSSQVSYTNHDNEQQNRIDGFQSKPGYKQWVAQAGTLVADLLACAGADHVYQGFFDVPVDNLYGKPLLMRYIRQNIPNYKDAVVISPDAGGAKRATAIADELDMAFALIHKERRPTKYTEQRNASMMLVGDVKDKVCILVDDLIDTGNTITRAAKLLKKEGATHIYALLTHGILSGDAIPRINASAIDKMVVTNTVPQKDHMRACSKLEFLDVSPVFAEAIRRVHHGESISVLFQHN